MNGRLFSFLLSCLLFGGIASADPKFITVASTTSTQNSGLFDYLLPIFEKKTGIDVRVVAVGTGQALRLARNGDADVLFVHHRPSEETFVKEGFGVARYDVMYSDFVFVGPKEDPEKISGSKNAAVAMIEEITAEAEIGKIYNGRVERIVDFGAFINILPGKDGLLHISQIAEERVEKVSDYLEEGQNIDVVVLDVDQRGRIKLSMREVSNFA